MVLASEPARLSLFKVTDTCEHAHDLAGRLRRLARMRPPTALLLALLLPGVSTSATQKSVVTGGAMRRGDATLMQPATHGTCPCMPPKPLRWSLAHALADNICCFNRHFAEPSGHYLQNTLFMDELKRSAEVTYYDTVTGKPLFVAPRGRSMDDFRAESEAHGWPSFRDDEVVWDNVRVLSDGETVSVDGTRALSPQPLARPPAPAALTRTARARASADLGHNIPDANGMRYCINLVSVGGMPPARRLTQDDMRRALRSQQG